MSISSIQNEINKEQLAKQKKIKIEEYKDMVDIKYANAYSEILEILKYLTPEDYEKIPTEKIEVFKTYANRDYTFNYDPDKTLQEQNVSKTARTIIGILFRDYWATEKQRNKIKAFQNNKRRQIEEELRQKYNTDDIFKNKNTKKMVDIAENKEDVSLVKYEEKWYKKIFNLIKNIFYKNK